MQFAHDVRDLRVLKLGRVPAKIFGLRPIYARAPTVQNAAYSCLVRERRTRLLIHCRCIRTC